MENMEKVPVSNSKKARPKSKNPQKSAAALRANLRRRKAVGNPPSGIKPPKGTE